MKTRVIELSTDNRQERMVLPVNPKELEFTVEQKNEKVTLLSMGEILLVGNRGLVKGSISSFFPSPLSPFFRFADRQPLEYLALLTKWRDSKELIRVIVPDRGLNLVMSIEKLSDRQSEGDRDIYFTLDLCEYRKLNVPAVKETGTAQGNGLNARPSTQSKESPYTVKPGDCLWNIAKKSYGDGAQYTKIYTANKKVIGSNPNLIKPGQVLTIP